MFSVRIDPQGKSERIRQGKQNGPALLPHGFGVALACLVTVPNPNTKEALEFSISDKPDIYVEDTYRRLGPGGRKHKAVARGWRFEDGALFHQ